MTPDADEDGLDDRLEATGIGPSIIGSTMTLRGDLSLAEDLIIEGTFHGTIRQGNHRLSIGEQAHVMADVNTGSAVIAGTVAGVFEGRKTVVVKRSARLHGSLTAERLCLESGAQLEDVVLCGSISRITERQTSRGRARRRPRAG